MLAKDGLHLSNEDLLIAVANTGHVEPDEFAGTASVRGWWGDLVGPAGAAAGRRSSPEALAMLRSLRDLVRGLALRNNGVETEVDTADLLRLELRLELRLDGPGVPSLRAAVGGDLGRDICAAGVTALLQAAARPGWPRFKACRGKDCRWVFVDASRNSSRRWCDMAGCGNRAKSIAFRRRRSRRPTSAP